MNNFFTSVFTRENITSMPEFPDQEYNSPLTDIAITQESHRYSKRVANSNLEITVQSASPVACKVMDKIVRDRIIKHLNRNQLPTDCQHGFIKGRSCVTQLLAMLDKWTEILDQGRNIDAIYLDFSKCFDSVPHDRLLLKLKKYGIQGKLWDWVADFLRGRKQQVSVNMQLPVYTLISAQWDPARQRTRTNPVHNICE